MRLDFGDKHSSVTVEYVRRRRHIYVHGHYDSFVGIEGGDMTLGKFLRALGVTEKDCADALNEDEAKLLAEEAIRDLGAKLIDSVFETSDTPQTNEFNKQFPDSHAEVL